MNLIKEKKWTFGLDGFFGNEKFLLMEIKMLFLNEFIKKLLALHELQNYMLRIIRVLFISFCNTRLSKANDFVPIILRNNVFSVCCEFSMLFLIYRIYNIIKSLFI